MTDAKSDLVAVANLPPFLKADVDLSTLIIDALHLRELAAMGADAFANMQATGVTDRMAALVYLQIDLCEALMWKIERLDRTHRLAAK